MPTTLLGMDRPRRPARFATAPMAAAGLIAGYAVAADTGSRPLGGVVLLLFGGWCVRAWLSAHGHRVALILGGVGLGAFVASHVIALVTGPWPAVISMAALVGVVTWRVADVRAPLRRAAA